MMMGMNSRTYAKERQRILILERFFFFNLFFIVKFAGGYESPFSQISYGTEFVDLLKVNTRNL